MRSAMYAKQRSFDGLCLEGSGTVDFLDSDNLGSVDCAGRALRNKRAQLADLVEISSDKDLSSSDCRSDSSDSSSFENPDDIVLAAQEQCDSDAAIFVDFTEPYKILASTTAWIRLCRFDSSMAHTMRSFLGPASNIRVLRKAVSLARSSDSWCEEARIILYDVDGNFMHLRMDSRRVVRLVAEGEIMCCQLRLRPVDSYR